MKNEFKKLIFRNVDISEKTSDGSIGPRQISSNTFEYRSKQDDNRDINNKIEILSSNTNPQGGNQIQVFKFLYEILNKSIKETHWFDLITKSSIFIIALIARLWLSIRTSKLNALVYQQIIKKEFFNMVGTIGNLIQLSVLSSSVDSQIHNFKYFLESFIRKNVLNYLSIIWLKGNNFQKIEEDETQSRNVELLLTHTLKNYSKLLSEFLSQTAKPFIEVLVQSIVLLRFSGIFLTAKFISGVIICYSLVKYLSPTFDIWNNFNDAINSNINESLTNVEKNQEEILFQRGIKFEQLKIISHLQRYFSTIPNYLYANLLKHFWFNLLIKKLPQQMSHILVGFSIFQDVIEQNDSLSVDKTRIVTEQIYRNSIVINWWTAVKKLLDIAHEFQELVWQSTKMENFEKAVCQFHSHPCKLQRLDQGSPNLYIEFKNVQISTPGMFIIFKCLNFRINANEHTLIIGPNGVGKSSIFRVIAGIWEYAQGTVTVPSKEDIYQIPQKSQFTVGNIVDQIVQPSSKRAVMSSENVLQIYSILERCKLTWILARQGGLDAVVNWSDALGAGEQQALALARLLWHKPKFAILDECTSHVDLESEWWFQDMLRDEGHTTLVSVSHRKGLRRFHDRQISISENKVVTTGDMKDFQDPEGSSEED